MIDTQDKSLRKDCFSGYSMAWIFSKAIALLFAVDYRTAGTNGTETKIKPKQTLN